MIIKNEINNLDIIKLCIRAGLKLARGFLRKPFIKYTKGFLFVGKNVEITHGNNIYCGRNVKFEDYSEIHGLCKEGLYFGNDVTIGRGVMIRPSSYYGIDLGMGLKMGDKSSIGPHGYIGCSGRIIIGKNVMIGPKCSLFAENHNFNNINKTIKEQGVNQKGITIEDNCWIGSNVIILDGVRIGSGSVIGAGSLVAKSIPPRTLYLNKRTNTYIDIVNRGIK